MCFCATNPIIYTDYRILYILCVIIVVFTSNISICARLWTMAFIWCWQYPGLLRQPKWGHLKDLHRAIKLCEPALVSEDPIRTSLGNNQEVNSYPNQLVNSSFRCIRNLQSAFVTTMQASVFNSKSGACAAFLANYDKNSFAKVAFNNMHYNLPPWSISILPDCKNTVYNTARVRNNLLYRKHFFHFF